MTRRFLAVAPLALTLAACSKSTTSAPPATQPAPQTSGGVTAAPPRITTTVQASLYDAPQATRGEAVYKRACAECHEALEYTGNVFKSKWNGRPVFELFDLIRTTMPDSKPNSLPAQEYLDIVGYMMKLNGVPAGTTALPTNTDQLKQMRIVIP